MTGQTAPPRHRKRRRGISPVWPAARRPHPTRRRRQALRRRPLGAAKEWGPRPLRRAVVAAGNSARTGRDVSCATRSLRVVGRRQAGAVRTGAVNVTVRSARHSRHRRCSSSISAGSLSCSRRERCELCPPRRHHSAIARIPYPTHALTSVTMRSTCRWLTSPSSPWRSLRTLCAVMRMRCERRSSGEYTPRGPGAPQLRGCALCGRAASPE
jgi:hypothetical protein